jgi:hypothetical protein
VMLLDAGLPLYFWPLAVQAAVHISNWMPHASLPGRVTPYFRWFGVKLNISHFHPFGAFVTTWKSNSTEQNKVLMCGEEGQFVRYARDLTGYFIYFPESRCIRPRRNVDFHGMPISTHAPPTVPLEIWKDIPLDLEAWFHDPTPAGAASSRIVFDSQSEYRHHSVG